MLNPYFLSVANFSLSSKSAIYKEEKLKVHAIVFIASTQKYFLQSLL